MNGRAWIAVALVIAGASPLLSAHVPSVSQRDAHFAKAIVGTWLDPSDAARSETTYRADGQVTLTYCGSDVRPDRGDTVYGAWEVRNGYLRQAVLEPDQGRLPVGMEVADKLISVNQDRHILITEQGEVVIRIRKPARYSAAPCG
jgi:hypothetical protein